MRRVLLTLTSVLALTGHSRASSLLQEEKDFKPIIVRNFVGGTDDVEEIIFEHDKVSIRTLKNDLISVQKQNLSGLPDNLSYDNLSDFLTQHSWVKVSKFDEENYNLVFNARCKGGMYQSNSFEDLFDQIEIVLGKEHKDTKKWKNSLLSDNLVQKKRALTEVQNSFFQLKDEREDYKNIFNLAFKLKQEIDNLPRKQFQSKALEYFQKSLGVDSVSFKEKMGGDQLGNRIIVQLKDGQEITYHAKTHRGGLKSQHSSSSQPVDLKELLIYKILEFSGIGAETHFFYDDIKNFYIATKDAGYDDESRKQGEFVTYEKIREKYSPEELLKDSLIVNGFIKTDIISRLLLLSDVINNGANTGLSPSGQFKVIDFNPPVTKEYQNPKIFEDWLSGNNQYNYSDPTVISILKNKDKEEKIKNSLFSIKELGRFEDFVIKSYESVMKNIDKIPGIEELQIQDLKVYTESIIKNHQFLMKSI